jgi:hypothetical protein
MSSIPIPTVTVTDYSITVNRGDGRRTVGYMDKIDAAPVAEFLRGALADAYHAGRIDALAESDALARLVAESTGQTILGLVDEVTLLESELGIIVEDDPVQPSTYGPETWEGARG